MASTEAFARFPRGRRPSAGSTTSARSATTQPNIIDTIQHEDPQSYHAAAWLVQQQQQHSQHRSIAPAPRQTSPDYSVHGLSTQPNREFSVEPSVHNGVGAQFRLHPSQHAQDQQQPPDVIHRRSFQSDFMSANGHLGLEGHMDQNDSPAPESGLDIANRAPAKVRANTNNDHEMRELFTRNSHRSLQDVATELHGNERGPSSERSRQLFAMLWIKSACQKRASSSVPRSRVYTSYVQRCAREKIAVLNPASFGKLVRVLYPGLKTRRLGVRGESKYHYVDFDLDIPGFELVEDSVENEIPQQQFAAPAARSRQSFAGSLNYSNVTRPSTAIETEKDTQSPVGGEILEHIEDMAFKKPANQDAQHAIFNQPQVCSVAELDTTGNKTTKKICLGVDEVPASQRLVLPPIAPYLPPGTDIDAAKSLEALYLSHCTSLIECIRFCKEKNFFHLFTAFHGTLTVPVQKLLVNPALEPWIELSDLRMYQNMMQIVSVVALQVIPPFGLQSLRNISEKLVSHIRASFEGQPEHVFRAKEAPAALFADLLDRALRVNTTAHATANFLHNHANRTQMYIDFIAFVRPRKIAQSVPLKGMDDVANLLVSEIRQLLDPRDVPWDLESITVQGDFYLQHPTLSRPDHEGPRETANILDRWVGFLKSLPSRFPYASHADVVQYVQIIGTTMMRDLTISSAESFGAWWCLKCWIDEMIWFLAEKGGFMKQSTTYPVSGTKRKRLHETEEMDNRSHKRLSTGSAHEDSGFHDDSQFVMNMADNASQVLVPLTPSLENQNQHVADLDAQPNFADDSGISLPMSGDNSPMKKFTNHLDTQSPEEAGQHVITGLR